MNQILIELDNYCYKYNICHSEYFDNKEFVLKVLKKQIFLIQYVSDNLKNDKEFMIEVLKINPIFFSHLPNKLKNDKDFIIEALENKAIF